MRDQTRINLAALRYAMAELGGPDRNAAEAILAAGRLADDIARRPKKRHPATPRAASRRTGARR